MLRQKVCYFVTKNWAKFKLVHVASNCVLLCFKNWSKFRLVHVVSKGVLLCYKKLVKIQASTFLRRKICNFATKKHKCPHIFSTYYFYYRWCGEVLSIGEPLQLPDCIFSPNFEEYLFVFKEALSTKETFMRGLMF